MKCVGVLAEDHSLLHLHMPHLQDHVRYTAPPTPPACLSLKPFLRHSLLLETPGDYSALVEYFRHCGVASPGTSGARLPTLGTAMCGTHQVRADTSGVLERAAGAVTTTTGRVASFLLCQ